MTSISATENGVTDDVLVVGLSRDSAKKLRIHSGSIKLDEKELISALTDLGATGSYDEVVKIPGTSTKLLVFTGLGAPLQDGSFSHERLRRAAGAAARQLFGHTSATFALTHRDDAGFAAVAEGALLGSYEFIEFKGASAVKDHKPPLKKIAIHSTITRATRAKALVSRAEVISRYTALVRDLINTPPSHLTPDSFSQRFKKLAASSKASIEILNDAQLKKFGYGGTIAVGQGSASKPRLVHISYSPKKAKARLAFVGKGITFDTGGLALKPAQGMEAMKSDMSGAAAVCAAALAIAEMGLEIAVDAWAPLAENMVSDTATRPSDIITIYGGKTVEVLNPDAEGRLILADALVRAAEFGKKAGGLDLIVDVATLTGAQSVALGTRTSAVMTNNQSWSDRFLEISESTGELFWPMPLPEELRPSLDSPVADIANIGDRMGGMLVAGLFLKEFVSDDLPWLHLDIAGPAFNTGKPHGYTPVGGTGVALRTLVALAEQSAGK
ncbi:MAG: leucyl aminopeptidase [Actinobacteria bacterium]|jgi:leucyl aminopeptidase|nr:leucyl aminopeptidase [Actinomycetota bacterium]NDB30910.1 leucyl aminopeptidase [Actinomycetota bacterium]NDC52272.1 leucyl aminopeptidase [Actinomycetota bacterium]NDD59700.1 leucyl aminopeptidase [Actinomycetota bacterium]